MSNKPSEKQDIPFQTPNPTELKQAAKDDPSQAEYLGNKEATVANVPPQQNVDQLNPAMSDVDSELGEDHQTIHTNISGH